MTENFNFAPSDMVHVDSYTRSNGTFVDEYWRKNLTECQKVLLLKTKEVRGIKYWKFSPILRTMTKLGH